MLQSEGLLRASLPETHVVLTPCKVRQCSLFHVLGLTKRRQIRAFNPEFAESRFSMKEVIVSGPALHSQHTQKHLSSTSALRRALHSNPTSQSPSSPGEARQSGMAFPSDHPRQAACTFSSLLIENAEHRGAWLARDLVPEVSAKSNSGFVDPKSHAER